MALRTSDYESVKHWEYRLRSDRAFAQVGEVHSARYCDDNYEYKHVTLTREYLLYRDALERNGGALLSEAFITGVLRVRQTPGWEHYYIYVPNPQVLCLRRPRQKSTTGDATTLPKITTLPGWPSGGF